MSRKEKNKKGDECAHFQEKEREKKWIERGFCVYVCVCEREKTQRKREGWVCEGEGRGGGVSAGFGLSFYNMIGCVREER